MKARRALHFVFKVGDRAETARFYRDVLGMRVSGGARRWAVRKRPWQFGGRAFRGRGDVTATGAPGSQATGERVGLVFERLPLERLVNYGGLFGPIFPTEAAFAFVNVCRS